MLRSTAWTLSPEEACRDYLLISSTPGATSPTPTQLPTHLLPLGESVLRTTQAVAGR